MINVDQTLAEMLSEREKENREKESFRLTYYGFLLVSLYNNYIPFEQYIRINIMYGFFTYG